MKTSKLEMLEEAAISKKITKKELERVMKGRSKKIKLWPNFSIGFELEILTPNHENGMDPDDLDADIEDSINELREVWIEEFYEQYDGAMIGDFEDFKKFLSDDFTDHYLFRELFSNTKSLAIKPKYGWACPLISLGQQDLMALRYAVRNVNNLNIYMVQELIETIGYRGPYGRSQFYQEFKDSFKQYLEDFGSANPEGDPKGKLKEYVLKFWEAYKDKSTNDPKEYLEPYPENFNNTPIAERAKFGLLLKETEFTYSLANYSRFRPTIGNDYPAFILDSIEKFFNVADFIATENIEVNVEGTTYKIKSGQVLNKEESMAVLYRDLFNMVQDYMEEVRDQDLTTYLNQADYDYRYQRRRVEESFGSPLEHMKYSFETLEDDIESIVGDGSLSSGGEIVTKVFKGSQGFRDSMKFLEDSFDIIEKDSDMETGTETGLHINIGTFNNLGRSLNGVPPVEKMDLFKMAVFLGEDYLLDIFNRRYNSYTKRVIDRIREDRNILRIFNPDMIGLEEPKDIKDLRQELQLAMWRTASKYSTINFTKLKNDYIEFRFAGEEYSRNIENVKLAVSKIIFAVAVSLDPDLFKNEYMKKVNILFGVNRGLKNLHTDKLIKEFLKNPSDKALDDFIYRFMTYAESVGSSVEIEPLALSAHNSIKNYLPLQKVIKLAKKLKEEYPSMAGRRHFNILLFGSVNRLKNK